MAIDTNEEKNHVDVLTELLSANAATLEAFYVKNKCAEDSLLRFDNFTQLSHFGAAAFLPKTVSEAKEARAKKLRCVYVTK